MITLHPKRRRVSGAVRPVLALIVASLSFYSLILARFGAADQAAVSPKLEIHAGDHICIIGNALAERMQHDGWLETFLHNRFPKHNLTIRNLGFSGDEVAGFTAKPDFNRRLRSQSFGTADQWLAGSAPVPEPSRLVTRIGVRENRFETTNSKADVIFAFFGYNESFAGEAGLGKFKTDLEDFIKHTRTQKYNGKSAPRLVLFSPVAFEDLKNRNLPDGKETNKRLELYTKALAEVAKTNNVPFVDLFKPTQLLYEAGTSNNGVHDRYTINGVHLNEIGNRHVASTICSALFGAAPVENKESLEKIRQAVLDKNFYWFNRYRVMDGYNVYGGRAFEKYADKQSNYEDQQRELEILDVKTANRDRRIWAIAASGGRDTPAIDDSNCPPLIPVKTNKPGPGPNGQHIFLDGQEAIERMTVAPGLKVSLFASEKEFPELAKPVQMQFDALGRLWVAVWPSYPHWKPTEEMNDKILIFEDTKGTGKADKVTVFADRLNCPTGFEFYNGGVLVAQAPDLLFLKDTKGTGKADLRVRMVHGLDSADSHHTSNSFALDPGGALYFQEGTFHHSQAESPYGPPRRVANGAVFRYEPRTQKFDIYVTTPFANPHGHVWDHWGQDFVYDGTGANPYHGALFSGHLDFPAKHPKPPQVYQQRTRPCPGVEILSSRHFPAHSQGNLLVANVIGFQGILQYRLNDQGASFAGTEAEPIVFSSDPNFRPSDLKIGPDGAIWFIDWHNPIIGHLQHAIRDPNRDRTHGRIYRVTYDGRPLLQPAKIAGEPIDKLLNLLKEPEDRVRYRAKIELGGRDSDQVVAATQSWISSLDRNDPEYEHHLMEGLWVHQYQNVVNVDLLKRMLDAKDFRARAAATRVLCYWRDRVPDALELLKRLAADAHPRVRLEAVRAASFFTVPEALEVALISNDSPSDIYLDFVRAETMRALEPYVKKAIAEKRPIRFTTPAGAGYFLKSVSTDDLLKMERNQAVYLQLLFRSGVRDEYRREALTGLAKLEKKGELQVLLDGLRNQEQKTSPDESVVFDLVRLLTGRNSTELAAARSDLESMARTGKQPLTRELGFVALIAADGNVDKAWTLANQSTSALLDLVNAMPLIRDPGQRASLYPKIEPLLQGLPKTMTGPTENGQITNGRFVRVELPGRRKTLTLAEVEVYSGGRNVAREGKASQISTAHGGDAKKAIDGNTSGKYADGGQTHTAEDISNPWWEVDLGAEVPVHSIIIYNRTDAGLGKRLNGYTLKILDKSRRVVFESKKQPAPAVKAVFEISTESPQRLVRRAAMNAVTSVRGQEAAAFKALAKFISNDDERHAAIQALLRIRVADWPKEDARPLLDQVLAYVRKVPVAERTSPAVLDALQFADNLASLLPLAEAKVVRKDLGELGVRVIRIGTVTDQMLFDKERIAVKAGKPVEIVFENTDLMPHNLVVTQPGALEEIGTAAEASATQPGALERHYVPISPKILFASRLLLPRETQKLSFTAPAKPGVYPYVCTYPGHWRRMYGALYVVADLDEYLADSEAYLAKNPLPAQDELLKFNRPRKEWKFEELVSAVTQLDHGRSFTNAKQMFQVATCISCHRMNGVGAEFGPDLTKLDPKQDKPEEILRDILEPSFRINEKYQTYIIETQAGKLITGIILEETPQMVKLIENPLVKAEPMVIKTSDIAERKKSDTSIMPKGLLDKLTKEEILDLVAYIAAKGNQQHKLFQGGHEH
jgi:putative heme-binding domain-containing protein